MYKLEDTFPTLGELREMLAQFDHLDDDTPVGVVLPTHDHWGNQILGAANSVEVVPVVWSEYHRDYKVVDDDYLNQYGEDDKPLKADYEVLVFNGDI